MIDEREIYRWFDLMKNCLTEVRIIGQKRMSGYFSDAKTLIDAIKPYEVYGNVYYTLNRLNPDCAQREQYGRMTNAKTTTGDAEVIQREWVLIDVDPLRMTGINSTQDELDKAVAKGRKVYKYLLANGFNRPIVAMSGNGVHLYLKCEIKPSAENTDTIKKFLKSLSLFFSDTDVCIDTSVFNLSRISKIPGTYSRKGADTKERPQRMCRFVYVPDEIKPNDISYFEKVANLYPEEQKPTRDNNYATERFDIEGFLSRNNIAVSKTENVAGGTKYILDHCLFNPEHKGKDAMIFQLDSGAIAYYCFHNSCQQYSWKDVRLMYEPDAYDRKDRERFEYKRNNGMEKQIIERDDAKGDKWLSMKSIKYIDLSKIPTIPTGFREIDRSIAGLMLGELSILSGINGSGKSSWINFVALNAIQNGYKVGIWSAELVNYRMKSWFNQCAAGKNHVAKSPNYDNVYYAPKSIADKIDEWTDGKLWLYNRAYGNKVEQMMTDISEFVDKTGAQLVFIDNLMAANISSYGKSQYENQSQFVIDIGDMAKSKKIHIVLVAHPRKTTDFLRKEDISGTADIQSYADNIFIIHRVDNDFRNRSTVFLGASVVAPYFAYDSVLEIAKNREIGDKDKFVGMYFEKESRRFKNEMAEHIVYGWEEQIEQREIFTNEELQTKSSFFDFTPRGEAPY